MNAKFNNGELFKKVVGAIREVTDEVEFFCSPGSIEVQAMDASHICVIDLCLKDSGFDFYTVEKNMSIGLNLNALNSILKMSKKTDSVELNVPQDSDTLNLKIDGVKKKIDFDIKLMSIEEDRLQIVDFPFSHVITLDSSEFENIVKDVANIGENCELCISGTTLNFSVSGDVGSGTLTMEDIDIENSEEIRYRFGVSHLVNIAKCSKLVGKVTIKLLKNAPFCCEYFLGDDVGHIRFYLAPRTDDDEAI